MSNTARLRLALALAAMVAVGGIAGCGGGGGGGTYFPIPAGNTPPDTPTNPPVTQSAYDAFLAYLKSVVETALDTAEPADVTAFDPPPVSDVLEPVATQ